MATKNLSTYAPETVPDASGMRFGVVCSEWNPAITGRLLSGAVETLKKHGASEDAISIYHVPGSFELTFGAQQVAKYGDVDAVIVLGCVVRGGTPHFDYVCQGVTHGVAKLNSELDVPVIFGILTTDNQEQALARAGGSLGNKGDEAAITAIKMCDFIWRLKK